MANLSQIQVGGTTYDICDVQARNSISQINNILPHIIRPEGPIPIIFKGGGIFTTGNTSIYATIPVLNGIINIWDYTPNITVTQLAMNVRQNNAYLLGSGSEHPIITSSQATFSISEIHQNCFTLSVTFKTSLGGTNNNTVAIDISDSIATLSYTPIN